MRDMINDYQTSTITIAEFKALKVRIKEIEDFVGLTQFKKSKASSLNDLEISDHEKRYHQEFHHE